VGKVRRNRADELDDKKPGRKARKGQALLRSWTISRSVLRAAMETSSRAKIPACTMCPPSTSKRSKYVLPSDLLEAGFAIPSRGPNQPHKVGDIKSCPRHRRRLLHSVKSSGRPNRAPIEPADSMRTQCRYKASMMTVPAYQRQGCSQSGNRLIVWPQAKHRKRRTQITIQVSTSPRTWREYIPCPTTCKTPSGLCAAWPQMTQNSGRRSSKEGASALLAQSCSTAATRLCRMTKVLKFCSWGGGRGAIRQREALPPPSLLS
jgi:hypothetical protein